MMTRIIPIRLLTFLIGKVIFSTVLEAYETNDDVLGTTIITEFHQKIELHWVKTESLLANEHLPVWTTIKESPYSLEKNDDIMKQMGEFSTYYDLDKSSAIILSKKLECIFGIIDVRYRINCLPLSELAGHEHKVTESTKLIRMNCQKFPDHIRQRDMGINSCIDRSAAIHDSASEQFKMLIKTLITSDEPCTSQDSQPPNKRPRVECNYEEKVITVYPEILIFIPHEIARTTDRLLGIVSEYITQFNGVAMLFAKLRSDNINIHINIAGIVIDTSGTGFLPQKSIERTTSERANRVFSLAEYIKAVEPYPAENGRKLFPVDSIDMFLLMVNEHEERGMKPKYSVHEMNLMTLMGTPLLGNSDRLRASGSIVNSLKLKNYVYAAREIAHLLNVGDDPLDNYDSCFNGGKCYAIMQERSRHCPNTLIWSRKNIRRFKEYLSVRTNRCYLRNLPRSLHPYGQPVKSLTPADQCLCYGYEPDPNAISHLNHAGSMKDVCEEELPCLEPETMMTTLTPMPIDGTPCDKHDHAKLCWRSLCV